jgi:hypothetical protein
MNAMLNAIEFITVKGKRKRMTQSLLEQPKWPMEKTDPHVYDFIEVSLPDEQMKFIKQLGETTENNLPEGSGIWHCKALLCQAHPGNQ